MPDDALLQPALRLAISRMFLDPEDVRLIGRACDLIADDTAIPVVVDLGAGSGTTALAVFCCLPDAWVTTIDIDPEALHWSLENVRPHFRSAQHQTWEGDAAVVPPQFSERGMVDLLLHDASHEYEHVIADLRAWMPHVRPGAPVWVHDYSKAPWQDEEYPGVRQAVDELVAEGLVETIETRGLGWLGRRPDA